MVKSNRGIRVNRIARQLGIKLPPIRGRAPHPVGDLRNATVASRFMAAITAHHNRNAMRHAIVGVLDLAGCYRASLTKAERRAVAVVAKQAFTAEVRQ